MSIDEGAETPTAEAPAEEADDAATEETAAEESAAEETAEVVDENALVYEKVDGEDEDEEEAAPAPKVISPYDRPGRWYVVHTQSGVLVLFLLPSV